MLDLLYCAVYSAGVPIRQTLLQLRHIFARIMVLVALAAGLTACQSQAPQPHAHQTPIVLAASSLQESLEEAAQAFAGEGHELPLLSFASSASLARQIERGAPADLFFSADAEWMNWLEQRGKIAVQTRANLLTGRLVVIAAPNVPGEWDGTAPLGPIFGNQPVAVAEMEAVPAGRYAKQALIRSGDWVDVEPKLIPAENVRAALLLVERGEAGFGIVYASDAQASAEAGPKGVRVLSSFPDNVQPAITYPAAQLSTSRNPQAAAFLAFLKTEPARAIFRRHGFGIAP